MRRSTTTRTVPHPSGTPDAALRRRRSEAAGVVPGLGALPGFEAAFDRWAAAHERARTSYEDAIAFLVGVGHGVPEPLRSLRDVERVYARQRLVTHDRRPDHRPWVVGVGGRVWHLGARNRA